MGVKATPTQDDISKTSAYDGGGIIESLGLSYADFTKRCNDQLAYALVLGMTPKDFWEGDVKLFWVYVKAGRMKREQEDRAAWVQGYYNNLAFADVLSMAFAGKGKKVKRVYPEEPVFTSKDKKAKEKAQKKKETAQDRTAALLLEKLTLLNERTNQPFNDQ